MNDKCSCCEAATYCPYVDRQDCEEQCDKVIERMVERHRREYHKAWKDYIRQFDDSNNLSC